MNSYKVEKILLFKQIIKGKHRCMICASRKTKRKGLGKSQFTRLRRTIGC